MFKHAKQVSIVDVLKKYKGYTEDDFYYEGNYIRTYCPFHDDRPSNLPSLLIYPNDDTTNIGRWKCLTRTSCGQGNVIDMVTKLGLAKNTKVATELLERDFKIVPPDEINVKELAELKGLDLDVLIELGWYTTEKGIVIPYYDKEGNLLCEKVRLHKKEIDRRVKRGISRTPDRFIWRNGDFGIYGLSNLKSTTESNELYIVEGETDYVTLYQAGFNVISVASSTRWQSDYLALIEGYEKYILVKDNDAAGDELSKKLISDFGDKAYIKSLPIKIKDINDFHQLRCGNTVETFKEKFNSLKTYPTTPEAFMKEIENGNEKLGEDKYAYQIIKPHFDNEVAFDKFKKAVSKQLGVRKEVINSMFNADQPSDVIFEENNSYCKTITVGGVPRVQQISNFVMRPKYITKNGEEDIYTVNIINTYDEVTEHSLTTKELTNARDFSAKVMSNGRNIFSGSTDDLNKILYKIVPKMNNVVHSPLGIGKINNEHWLFGNCGVNSKNEIIPVKDGIVNLDGKRYKPKSIIVNDDEEYTKKYMPIFNLENAPLTNEELKDFALMFKDNLGSYNAWAGLGWSVAVWFSDYIFNKFSFFPILFLVGKKGQGKTTLARLLYQTFGFNPISSASFDDSTPASMSRYLGYPHSLPAWYDDYKDNGELDRKTQMLLGVYNRQGGDRADRASEGIHKRPVKAALLLSGEYEPSRSALKDRFITLIVNGRNRNNDLYYKVREYFERYQRNCLNIATQIHSDAGKLLSRIEYYGELFMKNYKLAERPAYNNAVMLAGFEYMFGDLVDLTDFIEWTISNARASQTSAEERHHIYRFFNDLALMVTSPSSEFTYGEHIEILDGDRTYKDKELLIIHKSGAYKLWSKYNNGNVVDVETLKNDIYNEAYNLGNDNTKKRFSKPDTTQRVFLLDLSSMEDYPALFDFVSVIRREKENYTAV